MSTRQKITFLYLSVLMGITFVCDLNAGVTLVKDGKLKAAIVIDSVKPTRAAQFAAYELQRVIKLMTGAKLQIVTDVMQVDGIPILVGESDTTRKLKIKSSDFKGEEYMVKIDKERVVLIGNDSPDYGKVDYADYKTFPPCQYYYRSTTYAVYDFLEKYCGVRFYTFGDKGIAFKKYNNLTVKPVSFRYSPKMDAFRRPRFLGRYTKHLLKRDIELLRLRWRVNTIFGEVNHNIWSVFFRYWGPAKGEWHGKLADAFIEKRPEYFAQGYAGTSSKNAMCSRYPDDPDLPPQLCTTNQGPVKYFADEAFKVYRGEKVIGARLQPPIMPGKPWYYPIQEDDISNHWCKCDKCLKSFSNVDPKLRYDYLHFDWTNRIAAAAAKHNPAIGISTLAYSATLFYPNPKVLKLQPNVAVQLCLGIETWYHPGIYSWQHKAYKNWIKNEASRRPLFIWTYMLNPACDAQIRYKYNQFFPVLYPRHTGLYFKEFAKDGIRGYFNEIHPIFHMLEAYIANKISFDPNVDVDKLINEYFTLYYGNAAEPMRSFYKKIEEITWNPDNYPVNTIRKTPTGSYTGGIYTEKVNWHLGTSERIAKLQKIIDQAKKQAKLPTEKQRVKWFIDNIWNQTVAGRKAFESRERKRALMVPLVTTAYVGECDGVLEKVNFNKAVKSGGWTTLYGKIITNKPELSFASDSKYFYLKYHESGSTALEHKKNGFWMNNIEIFLAAKPEYPYGQLAISTSGKFEALRYQIIEGVSRMNKWVIKPIIKNQLDKNGWTLTVAIPLKQLLSGREVVPGDKIYANFMRTRRFGSQKSWSWSPIFAEGYADNLQRMGIILIAPIKTKDSLPVNGDFKSASNVTPDGWAHTKLPSLAPHGKITSDHRRVNISSCGKSVYLSLRQIFQAQPGDQIVFEFIARGKGRGSVGADYYDANGYIAGRSNIIKVTNDPKKYKFILTIANVKPKRFVTGFKPFLSVSPGSQVEYFQLRIYYIKTK